MNTHVYGIWTPLVQEFIDNVCPKEHQEAMNAYLDDAGATQFFLGQHHYFYQHLGSYEEAAHFYSENVFHLSAEQIKAGFMAWFNAMLSQFPTLNNKEIQEDYKNFSEQCMSEKFHDFIGLRGSITWRMVKKGNLKDIDFVINSYKLISEAAELSIVAMNEFIEKNRPSVTPIPRGPSSPTFLREPQVEEKSGALKAQLEI